MEGNTYSYLELTALPAVGEALLLPRAAFVVSADGARLLWANTAALPLFNAPSVSAALALRLSDLNPLKTQMARLSRLLPSETSRVEMLRIGAGVAITALPAACRRLNLAEGERAVLAVAASGGGGESLTARAEKLVDAIGARDCLAAVLTADGKAVAGSGRFDELAAAGPAIDALVAEARTAPERVVKGVVAGARPAGAARFNEGGRTCTLLIVGPPEAEIATAAAPPAIDAAETPIELMFPPLDEDDENSGATVDSPPAAPAPTGSAAPDKPPPPPEPRKDLAPVVRFTWETDAALRFSSVSPELAGAVGKNGAVAGHSFATVAARLGIDPDGTIATALAARSRFAETVFWPTAAGDAVAVALSGGPFFSGRSSSPQEASREFSGYRGFGTIHADVRRPDERADTTPLAPASTPATIPQAETQPQADIIEEPSAEAPEPGLSSDAPSEGAAAAPEEAAPATVEAEEATPVAREESSPPDDIDDAARSAVEQTGRRGISWAPVKSSPETRPAASETPVPQEEEKDEEEPAPPPETEAGVAAPSSNVVMLPGAQHPPRTPPEHLSGTERDAFRRIAEALGARRAGTPEDDGNESEAAKFARRESAKGPAADIDTRVLDRLPIGLVVFRDRRTLFANRTLLELLGYPTFDAFLAAGGAEAIFPGGDGIASHVAEAGGKLAAVRRDGRPVPVQVWLHAITFGSSTALMLSLNPSREENLDDEVEIELDRLEERTRELEAILDTATDGVIVFDGRGKIERLNRAAEALFGVNGSEYAGRYFTDLLADESQKPALDYLDGLASNGVASVLNDGREVIGRVPQGGLIPLFMTMGRIAGLDKFCAVLRDITHWKNIEAELTAARRSAETANAQKSDFLAKISHEIRTPLNAIIGFSEVMMSERFGPIGNERYRDYLHDINVSGAHLMSLINDLLDLSKIEAGKLDLVFEAVPVNASIQECVALMQPQANRERILIRTSLASDVPSVVADQRSFRQILLNLMSNAIKFTRAGGQVIVSSTLEANGEVTVRIRDTGIGMSEKDIETALKPFRQVALSRGEREHGTGLGLPLTKAMVEANRATFAIDSAPDQGTLVKITFPTTRVLTG